MAKKEFTATQVMALQERLEKGIVVIGEQFLGLKKDVGELKVDMKEVKDNVAIIKSSLPLKADKTELNNLEERVEVLEAKVV